MRPSTYKKRKAYICKMCKTQYVGGYNKTFCSVECLRKHYDLIQAEIDAHPEAHPLYVRKQCSVCGRTMLVGRNATRCAACQKLRQDQSSKDTQIRRANGSIKKVGEECVCDRCGATYRSTSPKQRHCPACATEAYKERDRARQRDKYAKWTDEDKQTKYAKDRIWRAKRKEKARVLAAKRSKTIDVKEIITRYMALRSVKATAKALELSHSTVMKNLCTEGIYPNKMAEDVHNLLSIGHRADDIANQLGVSKKVIDKYLPYTKGSYLTTEKTPNAKRIADLREKRRVAEKKQKHCDRTVLVSKDCVICGKSFQTYQPQTNFCSDECRKIRKKECGKQYNAERREKGI